MTVSTNKVPRAVTIVSAHPLDGPSMQRYPSTAFYGWQSAGVKVSLLNPISITSRAAKKLSLHPALHKWCGYIDKYLLTAIRLAITLPRHQAVHFANHADAPSAWALRWCGSRTVITTVHDLFAINAARGNEPDFRVGISGKVLQRCISRAIMTTDVVVSVSQVTQTDLWRTLGKQSVVVHNSLPDEVLRSATLPTQLESPRHFLIVASPHFRKNRESGIRIFLRLRRNPNFARHSLIIVGAELTDSERLLVQLDESSEKARVHVKQNVAESDLHKLYTGAEAVIVASLREGFGWPIIEANAFGAPAICLDLAYSREVGEQGALFIRQDFCDHDIDEIGRALAYGREGLRVAASENAQRFSTQHLAMRWDEVAKLAGLKSGIIG